MIKADRVFKKVRRSLGGGGREKQLTQDGLKEEGVKDKRETTWGGNKSGR